MTDSVTWQHFREQIGEALQLLQDHGRFEGAGRAPAPAISLPSLLEQCREISEQAETEPEPIRSIHHFACTGGTLISRCLATSPNVRMLSELDPLSRMPHDGMFLPNNLIALARTGMRPVGDEVAVKIFLAGLLALRTETRRIGQYLVLRDHAHSLFCTEAEISDRPGLREILVTAEISVVSLVTVRHPLDSFLSLQEHGWLHFTPATLEEYAQRYLEFLDRHAGIQILRYEDFISDPEGRLSWSCEILRIPFNPEFRNLFQAVQLSGDSGRRGDEITPRPRRPISDDVARQLSNSPSYNQLCERLDYDPSPRDALCP